MRVLVVGGGGREHALCWKLRQSPRLGALYCAPGNAGIAGVAECVPVAADDLAKLLRFAKEQAIDLTVVGPELPRPMGPVDRFGAAGLRAFGPTAAAARLEGSKAFAKELLRHAHVPTAFFGVFADPDDATRYVNEVGAPVVVKADGLAGGKGVFICRTVAEADEAIDELMRRGSSATPAAAWSSRSSSRATRSRSWRSRTGRPSCRSRRPRTTSASSTATRARTPAAWAPTHRRPPSRRRSRARSCSRSSSPSFRRSRSRARRTRACCTPVSWCTTGARRC